MESFGFPDWNKIGRDIGKRLRDIINPPSGDSGPSKEERKEQRLRDVHKGFAYFDNFDEIESWSPEHVDPLQRSNTPLFERPTTPVSDQSKPSAKVLLCHDYNGGYHDYESVRPSKLDAELYSCEYLQYVDTFIYFSHKLVCIPPPTWTNTLHRNGVKALGTFIIEPQTQDEQRTLSQTDGRFCVAEQLAAMAQEFGFDGWLVNIEKEFSSCVTESLVSFMKNLKDALGHHGQVIWYDALDVDNQVNYQNGLTPRNLKFALAADGILTNYKWLEANIHDSAKIATVNAIGLSQVFFGIDVWAQNTNMPGPPRITFPPVGGGGTNTGLAVKVLANQGFSAAVFAPAWTYEHFPTNEGDGRSRNSIAKAVDQSMWEGAALPRELHCDCHEGRPHHTLSYRQNYITRYAREFPAGTETFLDSSFCGAFQNLPVNENKVQRLRSTLGSQELLPHLLPMPFPDWDAISKGPSRRLIYAERVKDSHPCLTIFTQVADDSTSNLKGLHEDATVEPNIIDRYRLCLWKLGMDAGKPLELLVGYRRERNTRSIPVGMYCLYRSDQTSSSTNNTGKTHFFDMELLYRSKSSCSATFNIQKLESPYRIIEVGIYCDADSKPSRPSALVHFSKMTIAPKLSTRPRFKIENIRIVQRGEPPNSKKRLAWTWDGLSESWSKDLPWSQVTGPFSHFEILIDSKNLGEAHCLEFPLTDKELSQLKELEHESKGVDVAVNGVMFGGEVIKSPRVRCTELVMRVPDEST